MLIIVLEVGYCLQGSITVKASAYEYKYVLYDATSGKVFVSASEFHVVSTSSSSSLVNIASLTGGTVFEIFYNSALGTWVASISDSGDGTKYVTVVGQSKSTLGYNTVIASSSVSKSKIYTNVSWNSTEKSYVAGYSNDLTVLPQGLTDDVISKIISEQLNTQTASGQTAQTIINNTTTQYNLYLSGDIDSQTMQSYVENNIDSLSDLTPGTLLDAMQINNGLTYNQAIQDKLLNTVGSL